MDLPDWLYSAMENQKKAAAKPKPIVGQRAPAQVPFPQPSKVALASLPAPFTPPAVDPDIPPYTGYAIEEKRDQSRIVPMSKIPDLQDTYKILQQWMDAAPAKPAPEKGWIWGSPDTGYNIQGAFRHSTPDLVGMQNKSFNLARAGDPEGMGTLANELTHYIQHATPDRKLVVNPYSVERTDALRESNEFDDSPFGRYFSSASPNKVEMESTLMDYWTKLLASARQQERHQQQYAPDLRPH